jgi:DNA-binding Xre family transcriptional regulator
MASRIRKTERRLWMRLKSRYDLIALMTQRGLSCAKLARWADCSKSMIGHLRSGQIDTCTPALAARIEHALGCKPGELFESRTSTATSKSSIGARTAGRRTVVA